MSSLYHELKTKPLKEHREVTPDEFDRIDRNMRYYDGRRYYRKVERALSEEEIHGRMLDAILESQNSTQRELSVIKWVLAAFSFLTILCLIIK